MTKINKAPRNILVLIIAKISKPFVIFEENIWVIVKTLAIKISNISNEKIPDTEVIMKNQNERPAVTATDLKRGDENCNFKSDKWMLLDLIAIRLLRQLMQVIKY